MKVEVTNPGGLVSGLSKKDLGRVSRPLNLRLFSLMDRMNLVEKLAGKGSITHDQHFDAVPGILRWT